MTTAATHHHSLPTTPLRATCGRLADGIAHTAHDRRVFLAYLETARGRYHEAPTVCSRCATLLDDDRAAVAR